MLTNYIVTPPALDDEDYGEEFLNDGPVSCDGCGDTFPASALYGSGLCGDCEREAREEALLIKPEGKCVTLESNGVEWKV